MSKKKALIFGITGQDGSYLSEILISKNYYVYGVIRRSSAPNTQRIESNINFSKKSNQKKVNLLYGDLTDSLSVHNIVNEVKPDEIYNLGAQSHVKVSFEVPEYTYNVVGLGALRILESIKNLKIKCKYLQASSSEMYGNINAKKLNEKTSFQPESPYATAKVMAYWTTINYRKNYNVYASNTIMFNHESPRRGLNFVTKKIVRGLCEIKLKKRKILILGNLDSKRDWGYAKEYCYLFWKTLQLKNPTDLVIATGRNYSVREFVELVSKYLDISFNWKGKGVNELGIDSNKKIIIKISPHFFRPNDVENLLGVSNKAKKLLNWKPKTSIKELIKIMVDEELKFLSKNKFY